MINCNQFSLYKLHTSVSLRTVFAADVPLTVGQHLFEETPVKKGKYLKFRVGTRMPVVPSEKYKI
jgi:hypothetical protein